MTRVQALEHEFVETLPPQLHPGVLYISGTHNTVAHLCCCGCGTEVITPLGPSGWTLRYDGSASLTPSVGNGALPCRSHYVIDHNAVHWHAPMTRAQHATAKISDANAAAALNRRTGSRASLAALMRHVFAPNRH